MRKSLLLVFIAVFISSISFAQITKGTIFLGGDLGFSTQSSKSPGGKADQTGITISPVIGKAVKENLVVGGRLNFAYAHVDNYEGPGSEYKTSTYGVGAFVRKYKPLGKSGFYIFLQGGINADYQDGKLEHLANDHFDKAKTVNISINAYPGISYAISKRLHLESGFNNLVSINYYNQNRTITDLGNSVKYTSNGFNLSSSLNNSGSPFYLGFRVLLAN